MGSVLLGDVLANWNKYELDDEIYLPNGIQPMLDGVAYVFPFDPGRKRSFEGNEHLLGIEQVCEVMMIEQGAGRAGVLQLVPKVQHTAGSPFWHLLHPLPRAAGGYAEWAIPAGAPPN